jgi:penicillin-binding protein 1A
MMQQVIEHGTGTRARLEGRPAAGKTGTTSSYHDAWFIGFTGQYVTGVWMGYDDNKPLKGVTGGGLPAEIWQAVMTEIHDGLPVESLGNFAFDPDSAVPQVVRSDDAGGTDPLAAALSEALGQPQPQGQAAPQGATAAPQPAQPADQAPGRVLPDPGDQQPGSPPAFPAETVTSGPDTETPADGLPADDPLTQALRGIEGVYRQ